MATYMCLRALKAHNILKIIPSGFLQSLNNPGSVRNYKRWMRPYLLELRKRRIKQGPEPARHPADYGCWNYNAEIFSFGKRLGEEFNQESLRTAFTLRSYITKEEEKRRELGIDTETVPLGLEDNEKFANMGSEIASRYVKGFLRHSYPLMFEEGICAVHDYLMSDEVFFHVSSHLGVKDLIMSSEYPPSTDAYIVTLKAVIGALAHDQGVSQAEKFVQDFIMTQLVGKDLNEIWEIVNPMGLLGSILSSQNRGEPESRLLWKSASETMLSLYHVGVYSDKELIGQSPGETVTIAEEMAARDALKKLMKTYDKRPPLQFGKAGENLQLEYNKTNLSIDHLPKPQIKAET